MLYKNVNKSKIPSNISSIGIVFKRHAPIVFGFSIITYTINLYKEILKSCKVVKFTYILDELRKLEAFPKPEELDRLLPWSNELPKGVGTKQKK